MSFFSFQDIVACTTGIMILVTLMLVLELVTRTEGRETPRPPSDDGAPDGTLEAAERERDELLRGIADAKASLGALTEGPTVTAKQLAALLDALERLRRANEQAATDLVSGRLERDGAEQHVARLLDKVAALEQRVADLEDQIERERKKTRVTLLRGEGSTKTPLFVECGAKGLAVARIPEEGIAEDVRTFAALDPIPEFLEWAGTRPADREQFVLLVRPDAVDRFRALERALRESGFDVGWDVWPSGRSLFPGQ